MTNIPNTSRDSLDYSKFYETLVLQQGVPWLDSDFNEQVDLLALKRMMETNARYGSCLMPAVSGGPRGYEVESVPATLQNVTISAGYASVYGTIVPTTPYQVPLATDYASPLNIMTDGTTTGVSGGVTLIDTNKKFEAWMSLVGCRLEMTSGTEIGNNFEITSVPNETSLTCSGGIGAAAASDTYRIMPPALPASVLVPTFKEFQLWVFWEWTNEEQDSTIVNPGVAVETCERRKLRWCVRAEDTPYAGTPDLWTFSLRVFPIASTTIEVADTTLNIVLDPDIFSDPTLVWTKHTTQTLMYREALVAATEVTLPIGDGAAGYYPYYVGTGSDQYSYFGFFELLDGSDAENLLPLKGSDGQPITMSIIEVDGPTQITDPSTQADAEGFLDPADGAPRLQLNFSETSDTSFTGDILVRCKYGTNFTGLNTSNHAEGDVTRGMFDDKILTREYAVYNSASGIDVTLIANPLQSKVIELAIALANRPEVYPSAQALTEDTWKILFSTGDVSSLGQGAVQTWWNRYGENIKCQSCYPSTASPTTQFTVNAPSSTGNLGASIEGWIFDAVGDDLCYVRAQKYTVSTSDVLDPLDASDWDIYVQESKTSHVITRSGLAVPWLITTEAFFFDLVQFNATVAFSDSIALGGAFTGISDSHAGSTDRFLLYEWDATSFGSVRIYLRGVSSTQHSCDFEVALNCKWEDDTSQWAFSREGLSDEATSAALYRFGYTGCLYYGQHTANAVAARWDDDFTPSATSWVVRYQPFNFTYTNGQLGPKVSGRVQEKHRVAIGAKNNGSSTTTVFGIAAVNFHNGLVYDAPDVGTSVTISVDASVTWTTPPTFLGLDERGLIIKGFSNSIAPGFDAYWYGTVTIDVVPF